jgi:hypothetical protein
MGKGDRALNAVLVEEEASVEIPTCEADIGDAAGELVTIVTDDKAEVRSEGSTRALERKDHFPAIPGY